MLRFVGTVQNLTPVDISSPLILDGVNAREEERDPIVHASPRA
jgi:hypothetical protein